jgi:hypothetical protein
VTALGTLDSVRGPIGPYLAWVIIELIAVFAVDVWDNTANHTMNLPGYWWMKRFGAGLTVMSGGISAAMGIYASSYLLTIASCGVILAGGSWYRTALRNGPGGRSS